MNLPRFEIHGLHRHRGSSTLHVSRTTPSRHSLSLPFRTKPNLSFSINPLSTSTTYTRAPFPPFKPKLSFRHVRVSGIEEATFWNNEGKTEFDEEEEEDLTTEGEVYKKTQRLVECSMFAALGGLAYILGSSLAIENYLGGFFALPIVFSSMRWGVAAGRKTMVATATLLLVLSGPFKALTYLLQYGFLGLTMGFLWRLRASWGLSIVLSAIVRAMGATGYVVMYSFLIRENILALITINIHASLTYILTSVGFLTIPSMNMIYAIFGILLLLNCGFFVFLLHLLYSMFFTRLGMKGSLRLPKWLANAL